MLLSESLCPHPSLLCLWLVLNVFWALSCISQVLYKESLGKGTPTAVTPEMERVKRNQENFSSVFLRGKNPNPNPYLKNKTNGHINVFNIQM